MAVAAGVLAGWPACRLRRVGSSFGAVWVRVLVVTGARDSDELADRVARLESLVAGLGEQKTRLLDRVDALKAENAEVRAENRELRAEVAELRRRLGLNSRNSSLPPSSDGPDKPPPKPRSLREKSKRKPGGQAGHLGSTLRQVADPDRVVEHRPAWCVGCGSGLAGPDADACVAGVVRRQVFDIPEPRWRSPSIGS